MNNLKIRDIAQKNVIKIADTSSIQSAIDLMYRENHRNIIVTSDNEYHRFGLLTANDLIRLRLAKIDFGLPINTIKYDRLFAVSEEALLSDILDEVSHDIECLCVTDENDNLSGVVFYTEIISSVDPQLLLEKRSIGEIIHSQHLKCAQATDAAIDVIGLMDHMLNDCVMIFDVAEPVGIITTKDVVRLFGEGKDLLLPVSSYMSSPIETISYDASIKDALDFIQARQFKRLIVEDHEGMIVGQITQGELISRIYTRWSELVRHNDARLKEMNRALKVRATKFEELSVVDHLTGVYNRVKFELELQKEIDRVRRYKSQSFSIIFFDVDHFKKVNDTHGHATGDLVLQKISHCISKQMRITDIFARWGGEEFVAILPSTALEDAITVADKLRASISELVLDEVGHVTCSFGVGEYRTEDTFHSIILRADKAMYQAKANGRNRVEIAE